MAEQTEKKSGSFVQRGFFLFALLAGMAVTLIVLMFWQRGQTPPKENHNASLSAFMVGLPAMGFPSSVSWGALGQFAESLPSAPGWDIRYNAAQMMARRGNPKAPLHILSEMLDEKRQMRNHRVKTPDGKDVPHEKNARKVVLIALSAILIWHKSPEKPAQQVGLKNRRLLRVYQAIAQLEHSPNKVVRTEAQKVRLALKELNKKK